MHLHRCFYSGLPKSTMSLHVQLLRLDHSQLLLSVPKSCTGGTLNIMLSSPMQSIRNDVFRIRVDVNDISMAAVHEWCKADIFYLEPTRSGHVLCVLQLQLIAMKTSSLFLQWPLGGRNNAQRLESYPIRIVEASNSVCRRLRQDPYGMHGGRYL